MSEVFRTKWFTILEETLHDPPEFRNQKYYTLNEGNGVLILPFTTEGKILLVRQFRPPLKKWTWELPSGSIEENESPDDAANRELLEETGYESSSLQQLGNCSLASNRSSSIETIFLACNSKIKKDYIVRESIEVGKFELCDFKELVLKGKFIQMTALGILLLASWQGKAIPNFNP
ncbi:MAG: NUDIX hydrolase [Verrucomicrobiota bacterium]|nr:NUDIX hydrolase [Verrucomicrobiota bacterium]